jgi:sucrose-6-phosphate hydrolase SacC (GH32 family)
MTVAWPVPRKVRFYASPNLKDWTHLSDFGPAGSTRGIWECPDLFPIAAEAGNTIVNRKSKIENDRWVLIVNVGSGAPAGGSGCQYFVGHFDGKQFTLDPSYPKPQPEVVPEGRLLADFEGDGYGDWRATGKAFGLAPARGKIGGQQNVDGFRGRGLVNTYLDGDKSEGTLTSPEFEITHDHLSFLIGGGNHAGRTCLNLLLDGRAARTATGDAAERLAWKSWDVREFHGRKAAIEIVDRHTGGWGHVNVDHILLADAPARPATQPALWADFGPDFYAAVSWSDVPKRDGRRLWLGWMSNWQYANDVPTSPWRSAMSVPRELALRATPDGLRLVQQPVRELATLRGPRHRLRNATLQEANQWLRARPIGGSLLEIAVEFEITPPAPRLGKMLPSTNTFGLVLPTGAGEQTRIVCDAGRGVVQLDRARAGRADFHSRFAGVHTGPLKVRDGRVKLRVLVDTSSVEVFAQDGETVLTGLVLPHPPRARPEFFHAGDAPPPKIKSLEAWVLRSAWE